MDGRDISILVVLIVYMIGMLGLGVFFSRKRMSLNDYLLGGRQLNPWVSAMSTQASDMSGWLLTGIPGLAFLCVNGAKEAIWTALGLLIGTVLNWVLVAKRLRVYSQVADNSLTIPSYFENRFKDKKGILRAVSAVIIFFFFTFYTASMFKASAQLFSSVFEGLSYHAALCIGAVVILIYTFLGGFLAVSWTDLFQGLLMFFALIIIPIVMIVNMPEGGMATVNGVFQKIADLFGSAENGNGTVGVFGAIGIISSLAWGLGYFGMPHILVRFMATKDKKTIKSATVIALIWTVISMGCALAIGILANGFNITLPDGKHEQILIVVIDMLFKSPILAGILLSAVLAAIMSTADSQLLVASSAVSNDLFKRHIKKDATDKQTMWVSRIAMIVIAAIAVGIAADEDSKIFDIVAYAWGGFGAAFGPVMIFSLYSKKITLKGAIASMITGALVTIVWKWGLKPLGGFWSLYELLPGFILATIVLWTVSLLDKKGVTREISCDYDKMLSIVRSKSDNLTLYADDANSGESAEMAEALALECDDMTIAIDGENRESIVDNDGAKEYTDSTDIE